METILEILKQVLAGLG